MKFHGDLAVAATAMCPEFCHADVQVDKEVGAVRSEGDGRHAEVPCGTAEGDP